MEAFAKETKRRWSAALCDLGIEFDNNAKERRQYFEGKYDHTQKKSAVQALKKWKKERKQYLLGEFHTREINKVDEFTENLFEINNKMQTDDCDMPPTLMIENMDKFPNKLEISQRSRGRNSRFSTSDVDIRPDTFGNSVRKHQMKTSLSFGDTEQLQRKCQAEDMFRSRSRTLCSGEQDNLQKLNKHWKLLKETVITKIQKSQEKLEGIRLFSDQQVTDDDKTCQKLKQHFKKAVEEVCRLRRKSLDSLISLKDKCQGCCSYIGLSDQCSESSAKTEQTDLTNQSVRRKPRSEQKVVREFPFCAEYDGYASRRTKTISESIQALLEERKIQEEVLLRQEVERQVTNILTKRMLYKGEVGDDDEAVSTTSSNGTNMQENGVTDFSQGDDLPKVSEDWVSGTYLNIDIEKEHSNELKVKIDSIENLFSLSDTWKHLNVYITASVMPHEKVRRKQRTKTRKGNDRVEFQDDLYFCNLQDQVGNYSIRFKVYQKGNLLTCIGKRCIGEACVWLDDLNLKERTELRVEVLSYL